MSGCNRSEQSCQGPELADIFRHFGPAYRAAQALPLHYLKVMSAIENCRTAALGGHLQQCDVCGYQRNAYNSCRNRHCPKCQFLAKEKWLEARKKELLPLTYYHVVFTIPDLLNPLALVNKKVIYDLLFKAASETLLKLGRDAKHLGADLGLIAVLHTWGQNLINHPHLHCIVPGGGLSKNQHQWIYPKKSKRKKKFFVHVNIISDLFKKIFMDHLKKVYGKGELKFEGQISCLRNGHIFQQLVNELYAKDWVTYCKRPFGGPQQVLEYLGRYTHSVAISNKRLIKIDKGKVIFRYRDYRDGDKVKLMPLTAFEFIRRFLLHILPQGFFKIRYYGILSSTKKKRCLEICRTLFDISSENENQQTAATSWQQLLFDLTAIDPELCPQCQKGKLIIIKAIEPTRIGALPP